MAIKILKVFVKGNYKNKNKILNILKLLDLPLKNHKLNFQ